MGKLFRGLTRRASIWHHLRSAAEATTERAKVHESSQRSERNHRHPIRLVPSSVADGCRGSGTTNQHVRESRPGHARQGRQTQATVARGTALGSGNRREERSELKRAL